MLALPPSSPCPCDCSLSVPTGGSRFGSFALARCRPVFASALVRLSSRRLASSLLFPSLSVLVSLPSLLLPVARLAFLFLFWLGLLVLLHVVVPRRCLAFSQQNECLHVAFSFLLGLRPAPQNECSCLLPCFFVINSFVIFVRPLVALAAAPFRPSPSADAFARLCRFFAFHAVSFDPRNCSLSVPTGGFCVGSAIVCSVSRPFFSLSSFLAPFASAHFRVISSRVLRRVRAPAPHVERSPPLRVSDFHSTSCEQFVKSDREGLKRILDEV